MKLIVCVCMCVTFLHSNTYDSFYLFFPLYSAGALVYQTLIATLENSGIQVSSEEFDKWHGANKIEALRYFVNKQHSEKTEEANEPLVKDLFDTFVRGIERAYFSDEASNIKVMPGVLTVLRALRQAGIKVAFNTGYPRSVADRLVDKLNLRQEIDDLIVAEEVS